MKLTIETESGGSFTDANEETLRRLLDQLQPENAYLIVSRDDREGYAQTALEKKPAEHEGGKYVVEYRNGDNDHWQAFTDDVDVVYGVLAGWAFDRDDWTSLAAFKKLDLGF